MYGSAQKNKYISYTFFAVLFIYLLATSQSLLFFAINISVILLLSLALRRINCHALSGTAILIYSVIIDIVCFYFFPAFPINVSLGAYIWSGLLFNFRSVVPALALGLAVQAIVIANFAITKMQNKSQAKVMQLQSIKSF